MVNSEIPVGQLLAVDNSGEKRDATVVDSKNPICYFLLDARLTPSLGRYPGDQHF
jgi:hypothetical protein